MIIGLQGKVRRKEPTVVHLDVSGVVYEVFISVHTSIALEGDEVYLHTSHIIREDAQLLFGFAEKSEKMMFDRLIKINGVGPKVGMAICSTYTANTFFHLVQSNDLSALKRVPGIGPKSASRILVELSGFAPDIELDGGGAGHHYEATLALESLGFKKDTINKVLKTITASDTASLVKEALKKLQ